MLWINGDRVEGSRRRRSEEAETMDRGHEDKRRKGETRDGFRGRESTRPIRTLLKRHGEITFYSADLH